MSLPSAEDSTRVRKKSMHVSVLVNIKQERKLMNFQVLVRQHVGLTQNKNVYVYMRVPLPMAECVCVWFNSSADTFSIIANTLEIFTISQYDKKS